MIPSKLPRLYLLHRILKKPPTRICSTSVSAAGEDKDNKVTHLNKGRLDWLFADGYRRPLAEDQGGKLRKDWICYGFHPTNEHDDWFTWHYYMFVTFTLFIPTLFVILWYWPDWSTMQQWAHREAYFELERREKLGLPYISKDYIDPKVMLTHLPTEEELGDFKIII